MSKTRKARERDVPLDVEDGTYYWLQTASSSDSLGAAKSEMRNYCNIDNCTEQSDIRAQLESELQMMEAQMSAAGLQFRMTKEGLERCANTLQADCNKPQTATTTTTTTNQDPTINLNQVEDQNCQNKRNKVTKTTNMSSERETTPTISGAGSGQLGSDPLVGLTGGSNRATTTERRTTTTTTTKRTIKSSDDFIPAATDIQQLRSESRTSSISSSSPIFNSSAASQQRERERERDQQTTSSTTSTTTTKQAGNSSSRNWADGIQSPFIQDTEEGRVLKLRFDVTQYEPDEIVVKTVDNRLTVQAKHEEKSENRSVYREYNREFHLPDGTDVDQIKSSLSKDGVLTVDCPLPSPQLHGASRRIPIERE